MIRLLMAVAISTLALASVALADDDYYDSEDQVIPRDSAPAAEDSKSETDEAAPAHELHPGTYFGDGDPQQSGAYPMPETRYPDGIGITTSSRAAYTLGGGSQHENLDYDQVYGPLWGVPGDAVGLEGYQHYYDLMMLGNPEMLPEGFQLPHEHNHPVDNSDIEGHPAAAEEEPERKQGLKLAGEDDW